MGYITPMSRRPELCSRVLLPLVLAAPLALPAHAQKGTEDQDIADKQAQQEAAQGGSPEAAKAAQAEKDAQAGREAQARQAAAANARQNQPAQNPAQNQGNAGQNGRQGNAQGNPATQRPPPTITLPSGATTTNNGAVQGGNPGAGASSSGGSVQGSIPKIQESGDYYILNLDEEGETIDLLWLTKMCQVATGKNFNFDDQTVKPQLTAAKVRMFGEKKIPKAEFYEFYQILMFIHGFTITKVGPDHLAVYLIQSASPTQTAKNVIKDDATYVLPDELDRYADQVATQIMTVLHLPNTDVRTLGSSLRGLNPGSEQGIMPVANTQSVVLRGLAPTVVATARILKLVDELAGNDTGITPTFEVIRLEWAAAEDLSDILEQLLEARKREAQTQRQANPQGATGQINSGGGESKILTYSRTNSLLVMALPEDMAAIKELVARLDVEVVEPERTYHVYALEHVQAKDLSEVLEDFIQGASRVQTGAQGGGNRAGAAPAAQGMTSRDSEVVVVPDEVTNSLLIAASRRRYEEVLELVQRLDRRQEQVLIETALIELSGSDTLDIGVELGGADLPGSGTGSFGLTSFGLSTFSDSDGDGVFDQRIPNDTAKGITAGLLDGNSFNLPAMIVALKGRTDTNVLNIPSVLVTNNGSATVKTLDEQPTTQITATGVGGQTQQNFNDYQKAGITMEISPSISASGYLRLQVSLEVATFQGQASGAIPPPRITRTINTQVNVPNGDTMVVGGIIVDNKVRQRSMVPWLGDIPLLGALFRRDTDTDNRTTLYFFVTPHILRDANFADLSEMSYKIKLAAAERIEAERVRMVDPSFGKNEGAVDLGSFDVPLFRSPKAGETTPDMVGADPVQRTKEAAKPGETEPQQPNPSQPNQDPKQ